MSGALAARPTDKEQEKGRVDKTRVKRYWPGKAPDWVEDEDAPTAAREVIRTEVALPVIVKKADDPRLRRLAQSRVEDRDEAIQRHREIRSAEIVRRRARDKEEEKQEEGSEEEEEEEEEEVVAAAEQQKQEEEVDEEEIQRRRLAVRERLLRQQQQRFEEQALPDDDEEEEEESSTEYETDSEDEFSGRRLIKPTFVRNSERETIEERKRIEQEEEQLIENEKKRLEERKRETRHIVVHLTKEDEAAARNQQEGPLALDDVDTDDNADEEAEYDAWKQREMNRIRRDRERKETAEKEELERERLKNMTEEERAEWERQNPKAQQKAPKKKWKFLQKYWHRGAFFVESADDHRGTAGNLDVLKRDYSAPTGEDKFDRSVLPKVMQVKNFGRSGRTKWTHLVAEDTTEFDNPWANKDVRKKYDDKMGGAVQDFKKPKKWR